MTRSSVYTLLCTAIRLAAVYLVTSAILQVTTLPWSTFNGPLARGEILLAVSSPVIEILFGALFWMFPGALARIAANRRSMEHFDSDIAPEAIQYLAFSVLGLWFAITGLVQVAYTIHRWLFLNLYLEQHLLDPTKDPKALGTLLSEVVKVALGMGLAVGARGVVGLFRRFREGGLPTTSSKESNIIEAEETT